MIKSKLRYLLLVFVSLLLVVLLPTPFTSCQNKNSAKRAEADSLTLIRVDSIINKAHTFKSKDSMFAVVDSLERVGDIGPIRANYERGQYCFKIGERQLEREYWKKVIPMKFRNSAEERYYFRTITFLANMLQSDHDFEGALRISLDALDKMKQSKECSPRFIAIQLTDIGICQLKLRHFDDAQKSFNESFQYFDKAIASDTCLNSIENALICNSNIILFYLDAHRYGDAMNWLNRVDGFLSAYNDSANHSEFFYNRQCARRYNLKARALLGLGRTEEAAEMFKQYQNSESYKKGVEYAPGEFLMAAKRYAEAAEAYADIEDVIRKRVGKPSLDIVQQYMFPKFRANAGAGYKDSAIAVGGRILDALDSAIVWQKQDDAAELATIYETQEKDRHIAEQELTLSKIRLETSLAISGLVVCAFLLFIFYRHRAAKRLEVAHNQLKKAYQQLEIANARAEESSRMKSNFIQQISHEIRTPLNVLSGFAQVITTPGMKLDEGTNADINRQITESTSRITGLVNKMLELSDANSKTVIEKTDSVKPMDIASEAAYSSGINTAKHLEFEVQVSGDAEGVSLQTNKQAACRALALLLDNAIKFTAPAEAVPNEELSSRMQRVSLRVSVEQDRVAYTIEDTGIGIPQEESERVFEEFVQLDEFYEGTGIGLTVARSIARRLGGDVVLDTTYTGGARFVFSLPI